MGSSGDAALPDVRSRVAGADHRGVGNPRVAGQRPGRISLLERTATKLNADKTRFDPRPVGVLLTFRFRDCSRPLPVRYERTPSVPGCQYPFSRSSRICSPAAKRQRLLLDVALRQPDAGSAEARGRWSRSWLVGRQQSPRSGVILWTEAVRRHDMGGPPRGVRLKLNADSLDLRPNHRRSAGFPLQGLLPSASGLR